MNIDYYLMGLDEDRAPLIEVPLTKEQAGELILGLIASGQVKAEAPAPEREDEELPERSAKKRKGGRPRKKRTPCPECGSVGSKHKNGCSLRGKAPEASAVEAPAQPSEPLTESEYDDVIGRMHDRDFSSGEYAMVNKLPIREVNAAVLSDNYEHYVASRA